MIERLLGTISAQQFLAEFYQRVPFALTGAARELVPLGSWEILGQILAQGEPDLMVVRSNERWPGEPPRSLDVARALVADGYTLLARHAERHIPALAEWAAAFSQDFVGAVNIHLYCTPESHFGFGWHYDAEEVFIVQTTGSKEYSLRKNTVNPWPVPQMFPDDLRYEREIMPLMRCRLQAGDWLYIPSGYWHMGRAEEEAISLAIGVMPTTGVDVFDFLRREVLASLRWRQRMPVPMSPANCLEELTELYQTRFAELADDLQRIVRSPTFVRQFLRQTHVQHESPHGGGLSESAAGR
jgi:ribosomal protein L16 Arg81 hydroxylase